MRSRLQSSTNCPITFNLVLASDHLTSATGKTPTVVISKNGGSFASPSGAVTEIGNGVYQIAGNATDRATLGELNIYVTEASCDPVNLVIDIIAVDIYDSVRAGLTALPNAAAAASNGLLINGTNTGSITMTGTLTITDGLAINCSTTNGNALVLTGNGTGSGMRLVAGATGTGLTVVTTAGNAILLNPAGGHAFVAAGAGSGKHALFLQGGVSGDAINATGGAGGVDIRGNITGSITGALSGSVGSVTGAVASVTAGVTLAADQSAVTAFMGVNAVETGISLIQGIRYLVSTNLGVVSGAGTSTLTFKDPAGANTRIVMTADASGNRSTLALS